MEIENIYEWIDRLEDDFSHLDNDEEEMTSAIENVKFVKLNDLIILINSEMSFDEKARNSFNKGAYHSLEKLRNKLIESTINN